MNGNSGEAPIFEFPKAPEGFERVQEKAVEQRPAQENSPGKQQLQTNTAADLALPAAQVTLPGTVADDSSQTTQGQSQTDSGLPAADLDRIEKEWVHRAKVIVSHTQDDPFEQKNEMSRVKAEYIKKRFNKTIPTDDTVKA